MNANERILQIGLSRNLGGIEMVIINFAKQLHEENIGFDYVDIYGEGLAIENAIFEDTTIYQLPNYKRRPICALWKLTNIIRKGQYKHVHINMLSAASLIPVMAARIAGVVPVVHSHNSGTVGFVRKVLHATNSMILKYSKVKRIACSECAGKWLFLNRSFQVLPNAIDVDDYRFDTTSRQTIREACGITEDAVVLGFLGRLSEQKNPLFLIDILHELHTAYNYPVHLLLVGDGDLRTEMEERVLEKGLMDYVHFAGFQKYASPWYSAMDMFLLPSIFEGLPLVAVEAQASGLPCFFSDQITREVALTDLAAFLPITESAKPWAETIYRKNREADARTHYGDVLSQTLFSVRTGANELKRIYTK